MHRLVLFLIAILASGVAFAQQVTDSGYRTVGYIKADGTVQDSSYRTIGHVRNDGTVQDASYRTIGHVKGVPLKWAAWYFFFCGS